MPRLNGAIRALEQGRPAFVTFSPAEVGLTPKQAARVLRFERAGGLLRSGRYDLAMVAAEAGYYDQAHLSNEWRALAGCTASTLPKPSQSRRRR